MLAAVLPVALIGAAGLRLRGSAATVLLGLSAGLGFAITAIASRSLRIPHPWWKLIGSPATWAIVAGGAIGMLLFALALQRVAVTTVTALVLSAETVVPSAIGLALLGDTIRPGFVAVAVAGLLLALASAALLARFEAEAAAGSGAEAAAASGAEAAAAKGAEGSVSAVQQLPG